MSRTFTVPRIPSLGPVFSSATPGLGPATQLQQQLRMNLVAGPMEHLPMDHWCSTFSFCCQVTADMSQGRDCHCNSVCLVLPSNNITWKSVRAIWRCQKGSLIKCGLFFSLQIVSFCSSELILLVYLHSMLFGESNTLSSSIHFLS